MVEPERFGIAMLWKKFMDRLFSKLKFLKFLDPDMLSGISLLLSVFFPIYTQKKVFASAVVLFLVLFFDVIDGVIARMKGRKGDEGYITDVSLDRVSEAIICYSLSRVCIFFVIVNTSLTIYSYKNQKHIILPLRQVLLGLIILSMLVNNDFIVSLITNILYVY